jgi:uncharacterized protein (TIGR02270 family)
MLTIIEHYLDEAQCLYSIRCVTLNRATSRMSALARIDTRLAAHCDGLAVGGADARQLCKSALPLSSGAAVFVAAVRAIDSGDQGELESLFAQAPPTRTRSDALVSAFSWVERKRLRGIVTTLISSDSGLKRSVGIAACAAHLVDPGLASGGYLQDLSPVVRARAFRAAGQLGKRALASACAEGLDDEDIDCKLWASWSAVLLGERSRSLGALTTTWLGSGMQHERVFVLILQALDVSTAHQVLKQLASDPQHLRRLIRGSGITGDSVYVPWLIKHMADAKTARLAGEAFTLIGGADLSGLNLDRAQPENVEAGPNEDPEDPNVDMDPDEGLPWPDPQKVEAWWAANASRFPKGTRYFMGEPVTRAHCVDVLKNGCQRQRLLAAHYLCLLEPGSPLFNTSAPAWRQQRLLATMA